jgi:hypothetical protein
MFVPVTVSMSGEVMYERGFDMLQKEAEDMTVPLSAIGSRVLEGVGKQMESEGAWAGVEWERLSEDYSEWKEYHVPGLPKLVGIKPMGQVMPGQRTTLREYERSGKMKAELLNPAGVHVTRKSMIYQPMSDIAGYHEFGTERMPARPPVAFPLTELREWDRTFVRWMNGIITQAGLPAA